MRRILVRKNTEQIFLGLGLWIFAFLSSSLMGKEVPKSLISMKIRELHKKIRNMEDQLALRITQKKILSLQDIQRFQESMKRIEL
ncbi:MAG: hypothetical protein D6785_02840 [Planctomycetota bacterium]|nr:MAG: hypothetical protein D6785_02840 [Planctomycetota bacterium]